MAEETLRRNLDSAFDPGPDFPHPLLLSRTMAILDAEAKTAGRGQERLMSHPRLSAALPRRNLQLVAAALVVVLAVAAVAAFLAINQYSHRSVPVRTRPVAASGTCFQGFHMVSSTVGWRGARSRTTDGGTTWRDVTLPSLPNFSKGSTAGCVLDAAHAWTTQATGPSLVSATQLHVLATADGGQTWQQGTPVPASGVNMGVALEFIDPQNGWLLTATGADASPALTRTLYATSDGGLHWSRLASGSQSNGSSLGQIAGGCSVSGMTFVSTDKGWLTWDCSGPNGSQPQSGGPVVAVTIDGGHTWTPLSLPSFPGTAGWTCGASPPLLSGNQGVLPVSCGNGWAGVYRTNDLGDSWTLGQPPFWFQLSQVDFVDATRGFVFTGVATSDLYRTTDSGRDWALVKKSVFSGQTVGEFQFIDATTGFALTSTSPGVPWKTTDGGLTWSLPASYRTIGGNVSCGLPSNPGAGSAPVPVLMASPTTGWAVGARRTTDGGLHWSTVAPPSVPNRSSSYAEFFLDATHAWVAQSAGSSAACADHIVTFGTADGGLTWQQAAPIPVQVSAATDVIWEGHSTSFSPTTSRPAVEGPWLYFTDPRNGWLLVESDDTMFYTSGPLYRTTDGGLHWNQVSVDPSAALAALSPKCGPNIATGMSFTSATTGWMTTYSGCATTRTLLVTHDGGVSWQVRVLAASCDAGACFLQAVAFFDDRHAMLYVEGTGSLLVTANGGSTWSTRTLPLWTSHWSIDAVDFINPNEGWALVSARLYHTSNGGGTWTLVHANLPPPPLNALQPSSLDFVDASNGFWATGSQLLKTTDGGHSWTVIQTTVQ
jgi:photosystem II stability/assembly factor-like uncharacterized protein